MRLVPQLFYRVTMRVYEYGHFDSAHFIFGEPRKRQDRTHRATRFKLPENLKIATRAMLMRYSLRHSRFDFGRLRRFRGSQFCFFY